MIYDRGTIPKMSKDINGKVVIVTGGAGGIGYQIADQFLHKGAKNIILLDINEELGNEATKTLNAKHGNKTVFFNCDLTTNLEAIWKKITENFSEINVLVNNAGILNEKNVKRILNINTAALIELSLKFFEHNRVDNGGGNGGTIINVASLYGYHITPYVPVYHASKFAVMGFTKSFGHAYNFKRSGVRVVALCPGVTATTLLENLVIWDDNLANEFDVSISDGIRQNVEAVGIAAVEVFERAESGTAWLISAGQLEEL